MRIIKSVVCYACFIMLVLCIPTEIFSDDCDPGSHYCGRWDCKMLEMWGGSDMICRYAGGNIEWYVTCGMVKCKLHGEAYDSECYCCPTDWPPPQ
jgi:hypothetical protein